MIGSYYHTEPQFTFATHWILRRYFTTTYESDNQTEAVTNHSKVPVGCYEYPIYIP